MDYLLPATVYQPSPRLSRGRQLKPIREDREEMSFGYTSESDGFSSDNTVVGRPATLEAKHYVPPTSTSRQRTYNYPSSPVSVVSSEGPEDYQETGRSSYAGSDAGTVFSESCPSLTGSSLSDTTSFVESTRGSVVSSKGSRNRYPALFIPRGSWSAVDGVVKEISFGMSPAAKIRLSPEALSAVPRCVPAVDSPPSLADESSVRSCSPGPQRMCSAPPTPDVTNPYTSQEHRWSRNQQLSLNTHLEIAIDEHNSILLSPEDAHYSSHSSIDALSTDWNQLMGNFPQIPGATPHEMTPITPNIPHYETFPAAPSDHGVMLPEDAMQLLLNLTRSQSPAQKSEASVREEMQERSTPNNKSKPMEESTPCSEYSQLSIPSPGGFFSSLRGDSRSTWCAPRPSRSSPPPPSSTTAENFYSVPWNQPEKVKETVLEFRDTNLTEGPPTVRQATFNVHLTQEDDDLYGSSSVVQPVEPIKTTYEYDEAYESGIKEAAEVNMDRTGDWLSAQTSYLAALRETNPLNDPADYPATPQMLAEDYSRKNSVTSETQRAVRFLEEANNAVSSTEKESVRSPPAKESVFLEAFRHHMSEAGALDTFIQSSSRLDSVQSTRLALPTKHVQILLNNHSSKTLESSHARPKYRGPFNQNPRATGVFSRTEDQDLYHNIEREQQALTATLPTMWALEAQRSLLYNGHLMACKSASEWLTEKAASPSVEASNKKQTRILDLGGAAIASWAWSAALEWPGVKVTTVTMKQQDALAKQSSSSKTLNPENHKVISVPDFWHLPFPNNHFDVISARTLHMYLRSSPVPDVESIDEWDMTLKECMRVLKPGGIFDFFAMDSTISKASGSTASCSVNLSPSALRSSNAATSVGSEPSQPCISDDVSEEFRFELKRRGYEVDGGCGRMMTRLSQAGFTDARRQYIGLPMGRPQGQARKSHLRTDSVDSISSHTSDVSKKSKVDYSSHFNSDGTRKPKNFRLAPRPISEVSTVSHLYDQYANVEAVQGPVGSTADVRDMSALFGESMWEEWLVRLRIEAGTAPENLLDGVHEVFEDWRRGGKAAWRGLVGWARKPTKSDLAAVKGSQPAQRRPKVHFQIDPSAHRDSLSSAFGLRIDTKNIRPLSELKAYTKSAVERGEAVEVPMMIQFCG